MGSQSQTRLSNWTNTRIGNHELLKIALLSPPTLFWSIDSEAGSAVTKLSSTQMGETSFTHNLHILMLFQDSFQPWGPSPKEKEQGANEWGFICSQVILVWKESATSDPLLATSVLSMNSVYCHPAYLTYMQSTSWEMPGWIKPKLDPRLPGEISITSDMQMTPTLWQIVKKN